MTTVTVTGAARLARVSRGTIYNKIESGELSKGPDGIDTSELLRVFGTLHDASVDTVVSAADGVSRVSVDTSAKALDDAREQVQWLQELVEKRDALLADKERQLSEAQTRLDEREAFWTRQVTQLQALLPAPELEPPRGIWKRIFG